MNYWFTENVLSEHHYLRVALPTLQLAAAVAQFPTTDDEGRCFLLLLGLAVANPHSGSLCIFPSCWVSTDREVICVEWCPPHPIQPCPSLHLLGLSHEQELKSARRDFGVSGSKHFPSHQNKRVDRSIASDCMWVWQHGCLVVQLFDSGVVSPCYDSYDNPF